MSQLAGRIHHLGEKAIIAIVILHLGALGFYWFALAQKYHHTYGDRQAKTITR